MKKARRSLISIEMQAWLPEDIDVYNADISFHNRDFFANLGFGSAHIVLSDHMIDANVLGIRAELDRGSLEINGRAVLMKLGLRCNALQVFDFIELSGSARKDIGGIPLYYPYASPGGVQWGQTTVP